MDDRRHPPAPDGSAPLADLERARTAEHDAWGLYLAHAIRCAHCAIQHCDEADRRWQTWKPLSEALESLRRAAGP